MLRKIFAAGAVTALFAAVAPATAEAATYKCVTNSSISKTAVAVNLGAPLGWTGLGVGKVACSRNLGGIKILGRQASLISDIPNNGKATVIERGVHYTPWTFSPESKAYFVVTTK